MKKEFEEIAKIYETKIAMKIVRISRRAHSVTFVVILWMGMRFGITIILLANIEMQHTTK